MGANALAPQTRCYCGTELPKLPPCTCGRQHGGPHRRYCSEACKRKADHLQRKIRRREAWLEGWRQEAGARRYSPAVVKLHLKTFREEVTAYQRELGISPRMAAKQRVW